MNKKILSITICFILLLGVTGCKKDDSKILENNELFMIGHTLDDGRHISFTFDVPYYDEYLSDLGIDYGTMLLDI